MASIAEQPVLMAVSPCEVVDLCAIDNNLYCKTFFPNTFRQPSASFHTEVWDLLEDRQHQHVAIEVFRGGAKTTTLRVYTSKRIAYGTSRTITFVSASQEHSKRSIQWLKGQIEENRPWTEVYKLSKGGKWTDEVIEIRHGVLDVTITVIAVGITGQIRGVNIKDYRPDLIVVDDPNDEENAGTPEQRKKIEALFFGALDNSLTPATECPDSKMVLLQTSLNPEDLINRCHADPQWASRKFGCFNSEGESHWPERFPTRTLLANKQAAIQRNQLGLWMREMECTIVAGETSYFKPEWIKYWNEATLPQHMTIYLAIDPVPPPSDREIAVGLAGKDYEVLAIVGSYRGTRYLLDYSKNQGHTPEWTVTEFFRLVDRWRPTKVRVEGVAYQRTLKWILEQEMKKRGRYVQVDAVTDRRKKSQRIVQAISGPASAGQFYCHPRHADFLEQYLSYPNCRHEDVLDAVAMAMDAAAEFPVDLESEDTDGEVKELVGWRVAP